MKKIGTIIKALLYGALLLISDTAAACDVCGGAGTGASLGVLPRFRSSFVGLRYQFTGYRSLPHESGLTNDAGSTERYHSMELAGRFVLHRRWHLYGFVPVVWHRRNAEAGLQQVRGLADPSVLLNFIIHNGPLSKEGKIRHLLQVGTGVKAPLGQYDAVQNRVMLNPNMQAGSGSWDGLAHALYALSGPRMGAQVEANGRLCGMNPMGYRFGHRGSLSASLFAPLQTGPVLCMPLAGVQAEWSGSDCQGSEFVDMTGGWSAYAQAGVQVFQGPWQVGLQGGIPLYTRLSEGHVKPAPRLSIQCLYYLKKNTNP